MALLVRYRALRLGLLGRGGLSLRFDIDRIFDSYEGLRLKCKKCVAWTPIVVGVVMPLSLILIGIISLSLNTAQGNSRLSDLVEQKV